MPTNSKSFLNFGALAMAAAALSLGGGVVHGGSFEKRRVDPAGYAVALHPTKGYRGAPKWKKRGKSAKVRRVPVARSASKAEARKMELRQHRKTAAIGVDPKYLHNIVWWQRGNLSKSWRDQSNAWDAAHA